MTNMAAITFKVSSKIGSSPPYFILSCFHCSLPVSCLYCTSPQIGVSKLQASPTVVTRASRGSPLPTLHTTRFLSSLPYSFSQRAH